MVAITRRTFRALGAWVGRLRDRITGWEDRSKSSSWLWLLTVVLVLINTVFQLAEKKDDLVRWFGWDRCHQYNPSTEQEDSSLPNRECLPGRITFIKYLYPYPEPNAPADRPNRVLQLVSVQSGQMIWKEQAYLGMKDGRENWDRGLTFWMVLENGQDVPTWAALNTSNNSEIGVSIPASGFIMRRLDILPEACKNVDALQSRNVPVSVFEYFVENSEIEDRSGFTMLLDRVKGVNRADVSGKNVYLYSRWARLFCDQDLSTSFRFGPDFSKTGYRIYAEGTDPK
jgi:hypothetical protein